MKRNHSSIKGPGWSKAFQDAANAPDDSPRQVEATKPPRAPRCDRSADIGTLHIWPEGAQVGDRCLCGKRKKYPPLSEFGK